MEPLVGDHDDLQQLSSFVVSLVDSAAYDYELREDGAAGREAALVLDVYERNLALQRVLQTQIDGVDAAVRAGDKLYSRLHAAPSVPELFETRRPRRADENVRMHTRGREKESESESESEGGCTMCSCARGRARCVRVCMRTHACARARADCALCLPL